MISYRKATMEDLHAVWDYNIAQNPEEPRNVRWKQSYIERNAAARAATFVVLDDGVPVGEITLDYHAESYGNPSIRDRLADGRNLGYVTALRIRKEYEGMGYVSELMGYMENAARQMGYSRLAIGVEAKETRNLAIYLHWGYDQFLLSETDDEELVLFYAKNL